MLSVGGGAYPQLLIKERLGKAAAKNRSPNAA